MTRSYSDTRKAAYRSSEAKRRDLTDRKRSGAQAKVETRYRFS